jgi:hypothetical protein
VKSIVDMHMRAVWAPNLSLDDLQCTAPVLVASAECVHRYLHPCSPDHLTIYFQPVSSNGRFEPLAACRVSSDSVNRICEHRISTFACLYCFWLQIQRSVDVDAVGPVGALHA